MSMQASPTICSQVRRDIVRMVHAVSSGHPGGSLGCVELFVKLYFDVMKLDAENFTLDGKEEDLFFLSNGHISPVWYSVLSRRGFFPLKELATFRKLNSRVQGHPATEEGLPGIRVASGSLGQGLSVGLGAAETKKLAGEDTWIYTLHGDGEMQEGQIWEAAMYAAHRKIDNIISFIDCNGQQIDGSTEDVLSLKDLGAKWSAFGWHVIKCDGHSLDDLGSAIDEAKSRRGSGVPCIVLMKTVMGKGVDFMEGTHKWHGIAPNDEQLADALSQLEETLGDY
ncbi:MAG TPA: transketolase [Flavobacteriales bacterium]|nr:transketolase [Flavobacteriales bacterium]HIB76065.1 transketolase [Flavobacteriales bacterium]HIO15988.1 transketolase [Flavobacteriales bacterium]HIO58691.1 transketolase [Flavobacteriales bacterium]